KSWSIETCLPPRNKCPIKYYSPIHERIKIDKSVIGAIQVSTQLTRLDPVIAHDPHHSIGYGHIEIYIRTDNIIGQIGLVDRSVIDNQLVSIWIHGHVVPWHPDDAFYQMFFSIGRI